MLCLRLYIYKNSGVVKHILSLLSGVYAMSALVALVSVSWRVRP